MLTTTEELATAKAKFDQIFQSADPFGKPFVPTPNRRAVIFPTYYLLFPKQYDVLVEAVQFLGETHAYYSSTDTYRMGRYAWGEQTHAIIELQRGSYDDIWYGLGQVHWESALYSLHGSWGVLTSNDIDSIVGGPFDLMKFLDSHLDFEKSVHHFLEYEINAMNRWNHDTTWIVELITNVFGVDRARHLFTDVSLTSLS